MRRGQHVAPQLLRRGRRSARSRARSSGTRRSPRPADPSCSGSVCGGSTAATSGVFCDRGWRCRSSRPGRRSCRAAARRRAAGRWCPGPKPSAMRSYAWRWVVDVGRLPSSDSPRRMLSTGHASTSRIDRRRRSRTATRGGRPASPSAPTPCPRAAGRGPRDRRSGWWIRLGTFQRSMLLPTAPMIAGSSVSRGEHHHRDHERRPCSRACATYGMPDDGEAADRDDDGACRRTAPLSRRWRPSGRPRLRSSMPVGEVLAVARDDEQRVVDADAEPDHRGEHRRDRADRR